MDRLKESLRATEKEESNRVRDRVEVIGLTIASCLNRAASHWSTDLISLDYEILEKAKKSFLQSKPYRIQVQLLPEKENEDIKAFASKLGLEERLLDEKLDAYLPPKNKDGGFSLRNYLNGVFLIVFPPQGEGRPVSRKELLRKLPYFGIENYDKSALEKTLREASGKAVKIANFIHNSGADSSCKIEISLDSMKAFAYISPPRRGGLHLKAGDVIAQLKANDISRGIREKEIEKALLEDNYAKPILAAEGLPPKKGSDAKIDYKVNIKRNIINLKEDAAGRVDFKNLSKIENVVVGQIIAEKIPAQKGKVGYTVHNRIVPTKHGKDLIIKPGKGTILSENGIQLSAEINGQVILTRGHVCVEPVYRITGDVGPKTGNINFLGSVFVGGTVLSGFEIKASGNVEIQGGIQKASVEAEGDIVVRSGIHGGKVETTGASVVAKFIQDADVCAHENVLVADGILRSEVKAENSILCHGRRAQILGGRLSAMNEIRARTIGSSAYTTTELWLGVNPFILSIENESTKSLKEIKEQILSLQKSLKTLEVRKRTESDKAKAERESKLQETRQDLNMLEQRKNELKAKLDELGEHFNLQDSPAKLHVERHVHPGVIVNILRAKQNITDVQRATSFSYENGYIKSNKLEKRKEDAPSYHKWKR